MVHVLIYLTCLVAGVLVGVYVERLRWNKLIERGIIPRPWTAACNAGHLLTSGPANDVPKPASAVVLAFAWTMLILGLGYAAFGFWVAAIFSSGFLGGFLVWLSMPGPARYSEIRAPYLACLVIFVLHRIEEKTAGFFAALAELTGIPTPEILSVPVVLLVAASVGGWLLILPLVKRGHPLGAYFAWTFFLAMGVTELAHFAFPILAGGPYGYFPGMATVVLLAPLAWWGILRLHRHSIAPMA